MDNYVGKVYIEVKSGPGDLVGVTECEIIDNKASFSKIQFNEAGEYVLSIRSSVTNTEIKEIKVVVEPEDVIIGQDDNNFSEDKKTDNKGNRVGITQIDQPRIKIDGIETNIDGATKEDVNNVTSTLGYAPLFYLNGYEVSKSDILFFKLYYVGIIPKVQIKFKDTLGFMKNIATPKSDTKFDIFLNSNSDTIKYIHIKFKVEKFEKLISSYEITGTMDLSKLYRSEYLSYNGKSFDVLRTISKELELGFNSNIESTNDEMVWKNPSKKTFEFIEDIMRNSYISDKSYVYGYIDFYYSFNYIDLEKELNRNNEDDKMIDTTFLSKDGAASEEDRLVRLILTNDPSASNTSTYFKSDLKYKNNSTKKNLMNGNSRNFKVYDAVNKVFQIFKVDSVTDNDKDEVILKGSDSDLDDFNKNQTNIYMGKMMDDNIHKNYQYSSMQNRINLDELTKISMKITLPNPNFNIYKFQKVKLNVVNVEKSITSTEDFIWRLCGNWLVYDISYIWSDGKLKQELTIIRKGLGKTPDEIKDTKPKEVKTEENNENNENNILPSETSDANLRYSEGEVYTVQGEDGTKYKLTIISLSEDGKSVKSKIEKL